MVVLIPFVGFWQKFNNTVPPFNLLLCFVCVCELLGWSGQRKLYTIKQHDTQAAMVEMGNQSPIFHATFSPRYVLAMALRSSFEEKIKLNIDFSTKMSTEQQYVDIYK